MVIMGPHSCGASWAGDPRSFKLLLYTVSGILWRPALNRRVPFLALVWSPRIEAYCKRWHGFDPLSRPCSPCLPLLVVRAPE